MKLFVLFTYTPSKSPNTWRSAVASCTSPLSVAVACVLTISTSLGSIPARAMASIMHSATRSGLGSTGSWASEFMAYPTISPRIGARRFLAAAPGPGLRCGRPRVGGARLHGVPHDPPQDRPPPLLGVRQPLQDKHAPALR